MQEIIKQNNLKNIFLFKQGHCHKGSLIFFLINTKVYLYVKRLEQQFFREKTFNAAVKQKLIQTVYKTKKNIKNIVLFFSL